MLHPTPNRERARNCGWTAISHCRCLFFLFKDWESRWFEVARKTLPHPGCIYRSHTRNHTLSRTEDLFVLIFFVFFFLGGPCVRNTLDESAIFRHAQRRGLSKKQNDIRWTGSHGQETIQELPDKDHFAGYVFIDKAWPLFILFSFSAGRITRTLCEIRRPWIFSSLCDSLTSKQLCVRKRERQRTWAEFFFSLCHFNTPVESFPKTQETNIKDTTWSLCLCLCGRARAREIVGVAIIDDNKRWQQKTSESSESNTVITTEKTGLLYELPEIGNRKILDI